MSHAILIFCQGRSIIMYICDVSTRDELAILLDIPIRKLTHILYILHPDSCYSTFTIKKKNGGTREISVPSPELMSIQRKIALSLYKYEQFLKKEKQTHDNISHAFEKGKSIITNAQIHRNKRYVLNIDLKDFFPTIHFGRVRGYFMNNRDYHLSKEIATIIAQLTCFKGKLPQGAPTSPIIANLICNILDMRLLTLSKKYKVDYTRYADDLTFSTNDKNFLDEQDLFLKAVSNEIEKAGFTVNETKTRCQYRDSRQVVTGLIVNKKINVIKDYYKTTRAMADSLYVNGSFSINGQEGSIKQLEGRFAFINQLDKYNNKLDIKHPFNEVMQTGREDKYRRISFCSHSFRNLNGREEQYRKFLFYKYFYANQRPLIITEGKTDIIYLKAALLNLYEYYPNLIEKGSTGYHFKISFFKRTSRMEYFLDISKDGADVMKKIYNYFADSDNKKDGFKKEQIYKNYYRCILEKSLIPPKNPCIFLFDNEMSNKSKPIYNFANYIKLTTEERVKIDKDFFCHLHPIVANVNSSKESKELAEKISKWSNLYLLTNQLIGEKKSAK